MEVKQCLADDAGRRTVAETADGKCKYDLLSQKEKKPDKFVGAEIQCSDERRWRLVIDGKHLME